MEVPREAISYYPEPTDALLEVRDITVTFGGVKALRSIGFSIPHGAVWGLVGPNGSGKTTLVNSLTGYVRPSTGSIVFDGQDLIGNAPQIIARRGIARTFQTPTLSTELTVEENVMLACETQAYPGILRQLAWTHLARARARAREILAAIGLAKYGSYYPASLPVGVAKRACLARALVRNPTLLLMDEPGAGLNDGERESLTTLLRKYHRAGITMLVIDHNVSFVMSLCSTVIVLSEGQIISMGDPKQVQEDPVVIEAYLGLVR